MKFYQFSINQSIPIRHETVDGVSYLVASAVAIKAGVLNNELVLADEIGRHVGAWNGRPFVVGHPQQAGENVTANDPLTLARRSLGYLFNADMGMDGKLRGEVWVDEAKARRLGGEALEVLNRLEKGLPLEISTAYFRDLEERSGTLDGKPYRGVARNLRPDHLAALLHEPGACSWADGCGAPRVNQKSDLATNPYPNEHAARLHSPDQYERMRRQNDKFGSGIHAIWGIKGETVELQAIRFAKDKFTPDEARQWLKEHDYRPAEFEEARMEEVDQKTQSTVKNVLQTLAAHFGFKVQESEVISMDELVKALIADGRLGLNEEELAGMSADILKKLDAALAKFPIPPAEESPPPEEMPAQAQPNTATAAYPAAPAPATNVSPCPDKTPTLPPGLAALAEAIEKRGGIEAVLGALDGIRANTVARKAGLVTELMANVACAFNKAQLEAMPVEHLETLQGMLVPADFSGRGGGPVAQASEITPLVMPDLFAQKNGGK